MILKKKKVDYNKQECCFFLFLLDLYLEYFEEYQQMVHIVLFSSLLMLIDHLHLHPKITKEKKKIDQFFNS